MKLWSLRARLMLLIVLALLPVVALEINTTREQQERAVAEVEAETIRLARLCAGNQQSSIEATKQLLMTLAQVDAIRSRNSKLCESLLRGLGRQNPLYANLGACDTAGNVYCSAIKPLGKVNIAGMPFFQRAVQTREFSIGEYEIGPITHKPSLGIGYPMLDNAGQVAGVVYVALDLRAISTFGARVMLPPGGTMSIISDQDVILAHYPAPAQWIGKSSTSVNLDGLSLLRNARTASTEVLMEAIGTDGVKRLYAIKRLDTSGTGGLFVAAGIDEQAAYMPFYNRLFRELGFMTTIAVVALVGAWILGSFYIVRPAKHLVSVARAVSAGDLQVRSKVPIEAGEFGEIGAAFNQMADTLERRIEELSAAQEALQKSRDQLEFRVEQRTAELQRSNEELEQFAYVASHDLQEPLRMVASYTQLLERRYKDRLDSNGREFIQFAVDGAKRMQEFIQDLLRYSRVGTQGRPFQRVPLLNIVQETLANLRFAVAEKEGEVTVRDLPEIYGDPVQLTQLFQNLIGNALKFSGDHPPKIEINARRHAAEWEISVADNGIGIDPKDGERIFIIFQRLHSREEYEGTGIGLAICKKIVDRHGGRIWVESRKGEGTIFRFTIPDPATEAQGA